MLIDNFALQCELFLYCAVSQPARANVYINELQIAYTYYDNVTIGNNNHFVFNITIPINRIQLWWPNGYGAQKLYSVTASLTTLRKDGNYEINYLFIYILTLKVLIS